MHKAGVYIMVLNGEFSVTSVIVVLLGKLLKKSATISNEINLHFKESPANNIRSFSC